MNLITITGHDGSKVDINPDEVVVIKDDPDDCCVVTFRSGSWASLDNTRAEVRAAIDLAAAEKTVDENGRRLTEMEQEVGRKKARRLCIGDEEREAAKRSGVSAG